MIQEKNSPSPIEPIISTAHRFETIAKKYIFQPTGFSPTSMKILSLLERNGEIIANDLVKMIETTKSNMSQRISFLEKEGYIKKAPMQNEKDKRKILLLLTKKGKCKICTLKKRINKAEISFEKKFSQEELNQHKAFFEKINRILDDGECTLSHIFHS